MGASLPALLRRRGLAEDHQTLRSVLEIQPTTNSPMASAVERSDAADAFARVLMGLSYPLQIVSQARELEARPAWRKPPKIARRWLAVIPGRDATELEWRARTLQESFKGVGLHARRVDLAAGGSSGLIRPDSVGDLGSGRCFGTLVLRRWPREVATGWLGNATAGELPIDWSLHIEPQDSQRVARYLKRQESWQGSQRRPDAANDLGRRDAEETRKKLIAGTDRPVRVAVALTVSASSEAELKARMDTLRYEIGLALGDARPARWEMDRGLQATDPMGVCNLLGAWKTLDCTSVASTWPFQPATVYHPNGALLGTTHKGAMAVRLDPFDESLESFGGVILAKVGAGKSYLLKLLAMRLQNVEMLIVEQRSPPEYNGVRGATSLSLAGMRTDEQVAKLREFIDNIWETAKRDPRPRLLVLDELWSLLQKPELATLVEEIARIGRHNYLSLWIATQQVAELLGCREGKAVLDNAAIRIYLKQHDRDLASLSDAVGLASPARRFIRSASRGQAMLDVSGLLVPVDIQADEREHRLISTDPREARHAIEMADTAPEDRRDWSGGLLHLGSDLPGAGRGDPAGIGAA